MVDQDHNYTPKYSTIEEAIGLWKYYESIVRNPGMRLRNEWQLFNDLAQDINFYLNRDFNWVKTIEYARTIENMKGSLAYLLERKSACEILNVSGGETFVKNCQIEIDKLLIMIQLNPGLSENKQIQLSNFMSTFTNNQSVLIFHYFMKSLDISIGNQIDRTSLAKFIHLILNKEFTGVANSDIYNRLSKAPNSTNDATLLEDLKVIRPLFEKVQLDGIVKMIDTELTMARKEEKVKRSKK